MQALQNSHSASYRNARGFSLFEFVVFIILVAIIYSVAVNRFSAFPGQAERANFLVITTQLQSAINLEMLFGLETGKVGLSEKLEGANPMDLLLEPPSNYLGAFDIVEIERLARRTWYFDRWKRELVYLVYDASDVYVVQNGVDTPANEIRFKIVADYGVEDAESGLPLAIALAGDTEVSQENRRTSFNGVVMRPVRPFKWEELPAQSLIDQASVANPD